MQSYQFENIYKQNFNALYTFAIKLTRNRMDADDLVQETAIRAYRNFDSFKPDGSFKNWCFTILKNTFISKYHSEKKKNVVTTPIEELDYAIAPNLKLDKADNNSIQLNRLKESIEELNSKSKEPITMFVEGFSYKEIARYLGIPIGTVKSRINFAKKKLRNLFPGGF